MCRQTLYVEMYAAFKENDYQCQRREYGAHFAKIVWRNDVENRPEYDSSNRQNQYVGNHVKGSVARASRETILKKRKDDRKNRRKARRAKKR